MNSQPQDPPWQAPENVWQQPSHGASPQTSHLPKRAGRGLGCAVSVIIGVVALVVIGGVIVGGVALYHLKDRVPGMHKEQFQTVEGLNRVMELTRQRFGDTIGYQLVVNAESFSVERVDTDNPKRIAHFSWYQWRGHFEDPTFRANVSATPPVDLSKFDENATVKALHDAPNTLHVDPSAVKSSLFIIQAEKGNAGAVEVDVTLNTRKGLGHIVLAADGTVKRTTADF